MATAVANERCETASMVTMHADEAHANYENELAAEGAGGGGAATHAGTSTFRFALLRDLHAKNTQELYRHPAENHQVWKLVRRLRDP